jgi:glycosyltransferase involved in cell wall biosynthesis
MKIGVVTTSYPRWPGDSAGSFVAGHVEALRRLGHTVDVVAAADGESPLFYRGGAPDALERSPRALLAAAAFLPRFTARILRRARDWDQIIAHWLPSAVAALPARKPLTAIAHGGDVFTLKRLGLLGPTLRMLRNARIVYVAEHLGTGIVQPMGLDLAHFRALGRAPASPPIVLVAARLVPIKGVDVAIEAMAHLPHAQLVIAGDGPERRALEARARRAPVTFLGEVDTRRRDELLRSASVVAVPSRVMPNGRTEGCPTIALEALAAGVPVVATIGRACELVPPDDPHALARAIDRQLAHRQSTYELVADLDWKDIATRLLRNE